MGEMRIMKKLLYLLVPVLLLTAVLAGCGSETPDPLELAMSAEIAEESISLSKVFDNFSSAVSQ